MNVQTLIDILGRVEAKGGRLDMGVCGTEPSETLESQTENDLTRIGGVACLAGWFAVSPEFRAIGGRANGCGMPHLPGTGLGYIHAMARVLGLPAAIIELITCNNPIDCELFYGPGPVTFATVREKLHLLNQRGSFI